MSDYEFPQVPEIDAAYRAAQAALLSIADPQRTLGDGEEGLHLTELISHLRALLVEAEMTVASRLGPLIDWTADRREGNWQPIPIGVGLTEGEHDFGAAELSQSAYEGPGGAWHGSPLERAAYAYKREAGWDFTPDDSGFWLLMLAPVHGFGGGDNEEWMYTGHLTGFIILHDRDHDGEYETIAHMWTASAWRRRGVARRLMAEARSRFPITNVERPYTADSNAFLRAVGDPGADGDVASDDEPKERA